MTNDLTIRGATQDGTGLTTHDVFRRFAASAQTIIDYLASEATEHQSRGNRLRRLYLARAEMDRDDFDDVDAELAQAEFDLCLDDCEKHRDLEVPA